MTGLNSTLNNLIAMVVILLALSLVVQAVQSLVKKIFKLKSFQIEKSLLHLFQNAIGSPQDPTDLSLIARLKTSLSDSRWWLQRSNLARLLVPASADQTKEPAKVLFLETVDKFKKLGRFTVWGQPVLDSISKADLLHVVGGLGWDRFDKNFPGIIDSLDRDIASIAESFRLVKMAIQAMRSSDSKADLSDVQNDLLDRLEKAVDAVFASTGPLLNISDLKSTDLSALITLTKDPIFAELAGLPSLLKAVAASFTSVKTTFKKTDPQAVLLGAVKSLIPLVEKVQAALGELISRWRAFEGSFDAVMQSFEERYNRHMKSAAIAISFIVVVVLNANFFSIYQELATSDAKRQVIIESRQQVFDVLSEKAKRDLANGQNPDIEGDAARAVQAGWKDVNNNKDLFTGYGFAPVKWSSAKAWLGGLINLRDPDWENARKRDLLSLLGWITMALLLSVGAPFWQDFLESLFGVKNLLRQGSKTRNVEDAPGAGQTKES